MISISSNLFILVLWTNVSSGERPRCTRESVHYFVLGCSALYVFVRFNCSVGLFKSYISSLVFCLVVLPIIGSGVLKSPIMVELTMSSFKSVDVFLIYFGALIFGADMFIIIISSWFIAPFIVIQCTSLSLLTVFI